MEMLSNGQSLSGDVRLEAGVYYLPDGIRIDRDGITIDGNGALLVGGAQSGRGITLQGRKGVTICNLRLQNYAHGIFAEDCQALTITGCQISGTAEVPHNSIFLDIWREASQAYGGGILLVRVKDSQVSKNDLSHQMCGLLSYGCERLEVRENLANYCSGFGFHLYATSSSVYEDNCADYCCRWQPRQRAAGKLPTGHMGADATGFLVIYRSGNNTFRRNLARLGGDGFFIAGMTPQFELVGCDDNLFIENDVSFSPNNGFEATFCSGNVFRDNLVQRCNYGFWLGFSRGNRLEHNQISGNRQAGIAVENGIDFVVCDNQLEANGYGLLLWSKRVPAFESGLPENDTSRDWLVENNRFVGNGKAIRIAANQDHGIRALAPSGEWGLPAPAPRRHVFRHNQFSGNGQDSDITGAVETVYE